MNVIKKALNMFSGASEKNTPVDADYISFYDSADPKLPKKISWANVKATLKSYFDTLYGSLGSTIPTTQVFGDSATAGTATEGARIDHKHAMPASPFAGGNFTGAINEAKGSDIASASTCDIGAATGNYVVVTGTTTITALGTVQAGTRRIVNFSGALTLTHNGTSLILPTGANITTAAGDTATFISLGSGNWVCTNYMRKDGTALVSSGGSTVLFAYKTADETVNNTTTKQDDDHLTLTVSATGTYLIELLIFGGCGDAAAGLDAQFIAPNGSSLDATMQQSNSSQNQQRTDGVSYSNTNTMFFSYGLGWYNVYNTINQLDLRGIIVFTNTGTFKLQWAQDTAKATDMYIRKGSFLRLTKVA